MHAVKQIFKITRWSFMDWFMDVRQIVVLCVLLFVANYTVLPLVHLSRDVGVPINILEPFLANVNSLYIILIIVFCWLVLISDYPKMEGNNGYILIRVTRFRWLFGKMLAFVLSAIMFVGELVLVFVFQTLKIGFLANGWSYIMRDYEEKYMDMTGTYEIVSIVDERIFNHYLPYEAFGKTVLILLGLFCMMGLIMIAASLGKSKMVGLIINIILLVGGFAVVQAGSGVSFWLPITNVMLAYQSVELIRLVPKSYSWQYFGIICLLLIVCCMILVHRGQVQKDGER